MAWDQILLNTNILKICNTNTYTRDVFQILIKVFKYFSTLILAIYYKSNTSYTTIQTHLLFQSSSSSPINIVTIVCL